MRVSRRALILGAGALGLSGALPLRRSYADPPSREYQIAAESATVNLTGDGYPDTAVWAYEGTVPGPELRMRRGQPVRITVVNKLGEDTTVHWHGIRLPNAMDGVPGLTQKPIQPGASFVYEFTPPDAGTFWYHPHVDTLQQLGRGLAGALIVEEPEPVAVDRDLLWLIEDWRLDDRGRIAGAFGNRMEAGMSGRIGNTVTINGRATSRSSSRMTASLAIRTRRKVVGWCSARRCGPT
jgi:FtsP/CotA-like multicopper oxidase with cupredoxin domain